MKSRKKKSPVSEIESSTVKQSSSSRHGRKKIISALQKKFDDNYDDSSDEEEVVKAVTSYNVEKRWKAFNRNNSLGKANSLETKLSFAAHASGLRLYYLHTNKLYYEIKSRLLSPAPQTPTAQLTDLIRSAMDEAMQATLENLRDFLQFPSPKITEIEWTEIKKNISLNFNAFKLTNEQIDLFIRRLKNRGDRSLMPETVKFVEQTAEEFVRAVLIAVPVAGESNRRKNRKILLSFAKEEITHLLAELNFDELKDTVGKQEALILLSDYSGHFNVLAKQLKLILEKSPAKGCVNKVILNQLDQYEKKILASYLEDLRKNFSKKSKRYNSAMNALVEFYKATSDNIRDEMFTHFADVFAENIDQALDAFYRPVLPSTHVIRSSTPLTFYASHRLAKRNSDREAKNLGAAIFSNHSESRSWCLAEGEVEIGTTEIKDIYSSKGRRDMVVGIGNYEKIYEAILTIKTSGHIKNMTIDDKTIVGWLRMILRGHFPEITAKQIDKIKVYETLHALTFLLFGCEAARNPAMIVINQMILDLIEDDNGWSFENAFTGEQKRMPMAPEGAVAAARSLENDFRPFMPYRFFYRGPLDNKKDFLKNNLLTLEARVVADWLKLKTKKSLHSLQVEQVCEIIESQFDDWFDLDDVKEKSLRQLFS